MISTGAFQTEMDASKKQNELVSKLVSAWEKKNSKVGRAAGVSLMALSLAACGSDDDTPFSQVDVDAAKTAALTGADGTAHATVDAAVTSNDTVISAAATTAALTGADGTVHASVDAAVTSNDTAIAAAVDLTTDNAAATSAAISTASGGAFTDAATLFAAYNTAANPTITAHSEALTTAVNIVSANMTTVADSITATSGTFAATDVVVDSTAGDGDTFTVTATAAMTTGTVSGIENVVINNSAVGVLSHDIANISDGTVTVNNTLAGGSTGATFTNVGAITIVAGTGVATLTVTEAAATTATVVDAGSATAVNLIGAAATSDLDLTVNGAVTMDVATADQVTITGTAASAITLNDTASGVATLTTSSSDVSLVAATNLADFAGDTVTGFVSATGNYKGGDYTKVGGKLIIAQNSAVNVAENLEVADGTVISVLDDVQDVRITANDDTSATTNTGITATVELDVAGVDSVTLIDGAADASEDTVNTLNVVANKAQAGFQVTTVATVATTLNMSGANAVTLTHVNGGTEVMTVNAAGMTKGLTFTSDGNALTVTGGSGDDAITATTGTKFVLDGGTGTDTLTTAADMTLGTFTGFEKLTATDNHVFLASQLSGQTLVVSQLNGAATAGNLNINGANTVDITSMDFSNVNFTEANDGVDMTGAQQNTSKMVTNSALTITGSEGADTLLGFGGADTLTGGGGADTLTGAAGADTLTGGEGADTYNTGTGSDTVILTETTAATDTVNIGATTTDVVTIQGFAAGAASADTINFTDTTIEALTAVTDLVLGNGTSINNDTQVVLKVTASGTDIGAAANTIITIDGNYASASALEDAIEDGGAMELVFGAFGTIGDSVLVAYDNGTDSKVAAVTASTVIADGANAASNTLTVTDYVILSGVADATTLLAADFATFA